MDKIANLKTLIVEDNFSFALEIEIIAKKFGMNVLGTVDNSGDALVEILDKKPDLIFMDIDIKGKLSGLQIAEKIKHLEIPIIFVTSFADDEHFDQAITIPNSTYVTKPVDEYTIKGAIALLLQSSHSIHTTPKSDVTGIKVEGGHLFLKRKEEFYSIEKSDIIYIESSHVYCKTITKSSGEFLNRLTLNEYAALLNDKTFIKPHRSYLINMKNITKVNMNENYIILEEHNVPISRNAKKDLKNILTIIS